MPFYEYQCQACGAQVEVLQKITDAPLKKCPECAKSKLVKLVSAPVFRLKGSGWYETDFKGDQDNKRNLVGDDKEAKAEPAAETPKADGAADAKGDAKAEPKADAKADAKADTPKPAAAAGTSKRTSSKPAPAGKSKPVARPAAKPAAKRASAKARSRR